MFEFDLFDQCMFLIGVTEYGTPRRRSRLRTTGAAAAPPAGAVARHARLRAGPTSEFLAFPAEEPPSIECNEDAGEEITDEG